MFPIVDYYNTEELVTKLEWHGGVFIHDPILSSLGKRVFSSAHKLFESGKELPPLEEKTMFPNTINTLPGASRKVIQRYVTRPVAIEEPFDSLSDFLSELTEELAQDILGWAASRYGWSEQTVKDVTLKDEWVLNVANYPFTEERDNQLLFPAHKDWGLMALYPYIDGPGLEVYDTTNNKWTSLVLPEKCLFCYAGDIFTRITDGKVKALLHRVAQPSGLRGSRTSVIFYADPTRDMALPNSLTVGSIIDEKLRKIGQIK
jgi:isopenicillin N synthase-like dioxygenase